MLSGDLRDLFGSMTSWAGWAFWILAVLVLVVWVPRLVRRLRHGDASNGQRGAAVILLVGVVLAGAYVSLPFSEGPYRCTSVVAGAEGRQTVFRDDAPRETGTLDLLQRRQQVCDDAAKARGVTSGVMIAVSLLLSGGVAYVYRPSTEALRDRQLHERMTA